MNKTLPAISLALLLAASADAQGLKFGRLHMKQRAGRAAMAATSPAATAAGRAHTAMSAATGGVLDEYEEKRGDAIFRYVYAYDKDGLRSSETIYVKRKDDNGNWGEEQLYDVGTYLYEYDGSGRVKTKTVSYGKNELFTTYRVMVDYSEDLTTYTRYELYDGEGDYRRVKKWSCYPGGQLASVTNYEPYDGSTEREISISENGIITSEADYRSKYERTGTTNDSIITYYGRDYSNGNWLGERIEAYRYEPVGAGRLAEYKCYDAGEYSTSYEERKFTFEYDNLGRLVSLKKYYNGDDDEVVSGGSIDINGDGVINENDRPARAPRAAGEEPEWKLEYNETYEYWGDEVYGVGNTWHDVFGMDGPLKRVYLDDEGYITETLFERDASGKLLSVTCSSEDIETVDATSTITVDADGHITKTEDTSEETYGDSRYYYSDATEYTWEGGQAVKAVNTWRNRHTSPNDNYDHTNSTTYQYAYGKDRVTVTWHEDGYPTTYEYTISDDGNRHSVVSRQLSDGMWTDDYRFAREVQQEDVSFIMPNISADMAGFSPDSIVVASVAGRVVCAYECGHGSDINYGFHSLEEDGTYNYMNAASGKTYFTIAHDGDETVCSDIDGRPVYVLADGRLVRRYVYRNEGVPGSSTGPSRPAAPVSRAATVPAGQAYDEISYAYDSHGRLTGRTEVSVSSDGTRTEEIKLEYTYNETLGVASANATAKAGVTLNGRALGTTDGSPISVFSADGRALAEGVTSFTPASAGIYVVKCGSLTVKVAVR